MPQMAFVKYRRSSFFAKPASCETLFKRTSTTRFTPASFSSVKNFSADFFVKPMVKLFILRRSRLWDLPAFGSRRARMQSDPPVAGRHLLSPLLRIETYPVRVREAAAPVDEGPARGFPVCRPRECAERECRLQLGSVQRKLCGDTRVVPVRRTSTQGGIFSSFPPAL